jgi:AsmA protein
MKRRIVLVGIVLLGLGAVLATPFLIDPNRFRPLLESELSSALGRPVRLGDLRLSLFRGSVMASDLTIGDDPAYSKAPFVQAKSVGLGVEMWPLITSRKLNVTAIRIEEPVIALIQSANGQWNFSNLGGKPKNQPPKVESSAAKQDLALTIKLLRISRGQLSIGLSGRSARPLALRDVSIEVNDFSSTTEFPFTLRSKVAGGGGIALDGKAGPLNPSDVAASPLTAKLKIDALDLAGSGITQSAPAFAGVISLDGGLRSDGAAARIDGLIKAEKLRLAREGSAMGKPVEFRFELDHNLRRRGGRLEKGALHIGSAEAHLTGTYADVGEVTAVHMNLDGPKMAVSELSELLPAMAVELPRGSKLEGGTASVKMLWEGRLDRLVTTGTVSLDNTKLANFDLGRKLAFVQALAGIKPIGDTEIQVLGASVHYSPEGGRVEDLKLIVPSIGNLEGAGTVSPSNDLAFQMRATVQAISVPFTIQGPAADPAFRPDVKGIAKEQLRNAAGTDKVKGLLNGILGRKR